MTIAFGASGATVNNATTATQLTPAYPTGITAGQLLLMPVVTKPETLVPDTPDGWFVLASVTGGTGTFGADTGPTRATCFARIADGSESGTVTVTLASVTNESAMAAIQRWTKTLAAWDLEVWTGGQDAVNDTSYSATGSSIPVPTGSWLWHLWAVNGDVVGAVSARTLAISGATFGTVTGRQGAGTTAGNDCAIHTWDAQATTGATGAPTATATTAGNASGAALFVRIAETDSPPHGQVPVVVDDLSTSAGVGTRAGTVFVHRPAAAGQAPTADAAPAPRVVAAVSLPPAAGSAWIPRAPVPPPVDVVAARPLVVVSAQPPPRVSPPVVIAGETDAVAPVRPVVVAAVSLSPASGTAWTPRTPAPPPVADIVPPRPVVVSAQPPPADTAEVIVARSAADPPVAAPAAPIRPVVVTAAPIPPAVAAPLTARPSAEPPQPPGVIPRPVVVVAVRSVPAAGTAVIPRTVPADVPVVPRPVVVTAAVRPPEVAAAFTVRPGPGPAPVVDRPRPVLAVQLGVPPAAGRAGVWHGFADTPLFGRGRSGMGRGEYGRSATSGRGGRSSVDRAGRGVSGVIGTSPTGRSATTRGPRGESGVT